MDNDDRTADRLRARRGALARIGGAGFAALCPALVRAQGRTGCVARPEQTEGPYFVATGLARSDIRSDAASGVVEPGVVLDLEFNVSRIAVGSCAPLPQARVELWQCNALGSYSGVRDPQGDTRGRTYLRGYQITDMQGSTRFVTIYPGWYPGRAVHLHFSIQLGPGSRREAFTSQLYFDDALSDQVFRTAPYHGRGEARVRNEADYLFRGGGSRLVLTPRRAGDRLTATFDIALQTDRVSG